jgi:hypothetical protein
MLELEDIKEMHSKAYASGQVTRERAADDMVFYYVTQWDDTILAESQLEYRGEFDLLKRAGRQIITDLSLNPVQADFEPLGDTTEEAAELLDGKYRNDDSNNLSQESYTVAKNEAVVCGVGGWELYTDYVDIRGENKNQGIKRRPLHEFNNNGFWDPNAVLIDKSDAKYFSWLHRYSREGYLDFVEEITGERPDTINEGSFAQPEISYAFPWIGGEGEKIYVVDFYHRELVKDNIIYMEDPFQRSVTVLESQLEKVMDELLDNGYEIVDEKKTKRWQVTKYIASGEAILSHEVLAGEHIPIVPTYGEHAYVEGEEHYEGVTRLAKDPQRLRNFQLSYLADIAAKGPRNIPIFLQEQIAGYTKMYNTSGIDNKYAYLLQNKTDINGNDLPFGPVGVMEDHKIPDALAVSIDVSRQAIEDVANPGIPQDVADPSQMSGKAAMAWQARMDMQSMVYQENYKYAKRRDAEIYASISSVILDSPRTEKIKLPDGTQKDVEVMQSVIDQETGELVIINDLRNATFDVYSKIGPNYTTQKEQTIERLENMIQGLDPNDPMRKILQLKQMVLMDGVDFDDVRDYARMQLILLGIKKPETDEEKQALEASKQSAQEDDAAMVLAKAEQLKGQADIMQEKREGVKMQLTDANDKSKIQVDTFKAMTERMKVEIEARKAGATITKTNTETIGQQLENNAKMLEFRAPEQTEENFETLSDEELIGRLMV